MIRSPAGFDGGDRIKRYLDYYQPSYGVMMLSAGQAFTPAALFAAGEQGAWYDPSDFSTMFQDAAGTTPVTAVEQSVGLIRDKSGRNNHASQATPANCPVLRARVNQLTYSEQFNNTAWTPNAAKVIADQTTAPNGTVTADLLEENGSLAANPRILSVSVSFTGGVSYTQTLYVKKGPGATAPNWVQLTFGVAAFSATTFANFNIGAGVTGIVSGGTSSISNVGDGWYRILFTAVASLTASSSAIIAFTNDTDSPTRVPVYNGVVTSNAYIWGADLRATNQGVGLPVYQRIAAATDYDVSGFPLYLSFDGSTDSLATGSIDPGAVDKSQVFAGVRKLSDAATGILFETSVSSTANNGTIAIQAPNAAGNYLWRTKGTSSPDVTVTTYTAPITNVLCGLGDISAPSTTFRVNAAVAGSNTTTQGTGNYLAYPLYIGRRGGSSAPFNGNLYSLIIRFGANLNATAISNTETWVNGKTLAY